MISATLTKSWISVDRSPRLTRARRALQYAVGIFALIPVSAGLAGLIRSCAAFGAQGIAGPALDSHIRYLSGLLFAIGIAFWSTLPDIERKTERFRILTFIVFVGGLSRLVGLIATGWPGLPMMAGLVMELVVTPLLCLWQARLQSVED